MKLISKFLLAFCIVQAASSEAAPPQGFLEGHLKIVSLRAVGESDDMPRAAVAPESYSKYSLTVLSQDGKEEIAHFTADKDGNYRIALAPGAYILDLKDRVAKHLRAKPQPFTVVSDQTVRVDMTVVLGFRTVQ
jgi:hypothetical protein